MVTAFVIAVGNSNEITYKEDSKAVLKDYFDYHKINSFFLEVPTFHGCKINVKGAHPSWVKLISHKFYPTDDFILCWDLDLLPINREKNILDVLDLNKLNMCFDSSVLMNGYKFTPNFKYNGGLCGIPVRYREFMEGVYNKHAPGQWPSFEQYYLNDEIAIQNIEVNELDSIWNSNLPAPGFTTEYFDKAFNKHYTWGVDHSQKIGKIKQHRENYFSTTAPAGK